MTFVFRKSKKRVRKKRKSKGAMEVLNRLEQYLKSDAVEEPISIMCGFWEDQQKAITYQELREAIKNGSITEETLRLWRQDYSNLVANDLSKLWLSGLEAGSLGPTVMDAIADEFVFNIQSPGILRWLNERGAEFVTSVTHEQQEAMKALLSKKMIEDHTVDELSRMIRPCIGLTKGQANSNARYYDSVVKKLRDDHPKMSEDSIRKKALDASTKFAEKQHRQRAFDIAQTESAFAYNRGADEGVRQAQAARLLGKTVKRWSTSGDESVCEICSALEGTEVDMDDDFNFKGNVLFAGHHRVPPAHPRCACAIEYIEIKEPK